MGAGEHRRGAGGRGGRRRLERRAPDREPPPLPEPRRSTGRGASSSRSGRPTGPTVDSPSGGPPDPRATNPRLPVSPVQKQKKRKNRRVPGDPGTVTEPQLIQRLRDGDQDAARALYDAHVDRVFRICYRFAGEDHLAQDFTQETFVRAFTKIDTFRGEAAFGTWLGSIATTVSLNGLRKVKRFRSRETALHEDLRSTRGVHGLEPDVKERLHRAIDELPAGYRTVFLLHDLEGYTHEEIGTMLGIKAGT
ncbi:MAG: RNA polymerase sigma factor, partial [Gemmatimonadales bacterium]|nr:RNA polymerase sigma factor [Gemmatimonadales bacterium]